MATGIVGEFQAIKANADADVLAMQCGDFYEFFGEDAELVARELDLKLSQKGSGGESYPMAGVPVDDLTPYLRALVERGYRVAVADQYQTEDGHARELTRIVTPGTLLETTDDAATYLAAIVTGRDGRVGVGFADITTGAFVVTSFAGERAVERAITECHRFDPVELLPGPMLREDPRIAMELLDELDCVRTDHEERAFGPGAARRAVADQFGAETIVSLDLSEPAVSAAGALLDYVAASGVGVLPAMTRLRRYDPDDFVDLDVTTRRNLELTATMVPGGEGLLDAIDRTTTAAGSRLLAEWVRTPRRDREVLEARLDCVAALTEASIARSALRDHLSDTRDLARLASRATRERADARTLVAIRQTLAMVPRVIETVSGDPTLSASPLRSVLDDVDRDAVERLHDELAEALRDDPPSTVTEGGIFRQGYDPDLDDLIDRNETATAWIDELAPRERERHDLTHLRVDRNRTDGYYLQVGNSEVEDVPDTYREIKTLKNAKRFTTPELEEHEREIVQLEAARADLEYDLFEELRTHVADRAGLLQSVGQTLATLDCYASLAAHASDHRWVRPVLGPSTDPIDIEGGRHPVVETTTEFVPNDVYLGDDPRIVLVTGPNMSGKSTYLRQTALIVLLAQIGSFVPASAARIGVVDGIYTRVGALDELSQGRSTFMVEMAELANILHSATADSLVVLDEVGRGTATYDGISIAWAATEYLHNEIRCATLFATHYHELTDLVDRLPAAANAHVAATERNDEVTFLRTVEPGPADRSYGIHVAELAGVPVPVRDRARDVLTRLREDHAVEARGGDATVQAVFDLGTGTMQTHTADGGSSPDPNAEAILDELRSCPIAELPPVELVQRVADWQDRLED